MARGMHAARANALRKVRFLLELENGNTHVFRSTRAFNLIGR